MLERYLIENWKTLEDGKCLRRKKKTFEKRPAREKQLCVSDVEASVQMREELRQVDEGEVKRAGKKKSSERASEEKERELDRDRKERERKRGKARGRKTSHSCAPAQAACHCNWTPVAAAAAASGSAILARKVTHISPAPGQAKALQHQLERSVFTLATWWSAHPRKRKASYWATASSGAQDSWRSNTKKGMRRRSFKCLRKKKTVLSRWMWVPHVF